MTVLALIPGRAGSKRIPGKNRRLLSGRPLIRWTLDVARAVPDLTHVMVSTDDPEIAAIGMDAGALVPWLRPKHLADDLASSVDVALHALDWFVEAIGSVDALVLLQPTTPFRSTATIQRGLETFARSRPRAVVAVSPAPHHPYHTFRINADCLEPVVRLGNDGRNPLLIRSQDLPPAVVVNGALYVVDPVRLRMSRSFFYDSPVPLLVDDPTEAIDIDTQWDWTIAECLAESR